jgi:FlaA1/EpsC-like NDP-sugar epimerase
MVNLSGLTIKSDKNPYGDIDIKIVGLRPGEKLYEELLIGENPQKTINPKIMKTDEPFIPYNQLKKILDELLILLNNEQTKEVKKILLKTIKSYNSKTELVDSIFNESKTFNKKEDKPLLEKNQNNIVRIK